MFSQQLHELISKEYSLLNTKFYSAWSAGTLPVSALQEYAEQYFHHEKNFPRYLSTIHSKCEDENVRQVILENLIDEEKNIKSNHKELWLRFAESIGCDRENVINSKINEETQQMLNLFFDCANKSTISGIAAMFAYETQVPEVYQSKIDGLKQYYTLSNDKGDEFFKIHLEMDKWHSNQWANILNNLNEDQQREAKHSAIAACKAMINFLDGIKFA
jgi:pyrroloquinoline-quinone synthase